LNFRSTIVRLLRGEQNRGPVATGGEQPVTKRPWQRVKRPWQRVPRKVRVAGVAAAVATATLLSIALTSTSTSTSKFPTTSSLNSLTSAPQLQLHVSGNKLVNAAGQPVMLRGVDRSGTEFMCAHGAGIFDGPSTVASIRVMKQHGINAVRVPLNEACWNGDSYIKPSMRGAPYRAAVKAYLNRLNANGMVAIIDLHWTNGQYMGANSACATDQAMCQKPMPDAAEAIPFWQSVARTFGGDDAVIFDLFNEPYPEQATHNQAAGWRCWLHGGDCAGIPYKVAGMQTLVNAVRSTGANNILMLGGLEWSNDLSQWLAHKPADPAHNLAASWHSYNFNACSTEACWNKVLAPVIAKVPLIAGEIGENDCAGAYVNRLTTWMDTKSASYLAWTWNSDFNCWSGPGLITDYNGNPTPFGAAYQSHLRSVVHTANSS
jgi:endoglucanase